MSITIDQEQVKNKAKDTLAAHQRTMTDAAHRDAPSLKKLLVLMDWLRSENGCPWDKEQTISSLEKYVIEEAYEVQAAMHALSSEPSREELSEHKKV